MGKTTKSDTGSGGDERDERKNRAGSNTLKASSSSTVKRLGDNESSRSKTGVRTSARQSVAGGSGLKQPTNVTVHGPISQAVNRNVAKPLIPAVSKEVKKPSEAGVKTKSQTAKMKQESEGSDSKPAGDTEESSTSVEAIKQQVKDSCHTEEQQHKSGLDSDEATKGNENGNAKESEKSKKQNGNSERDEEFKLHLEGDEQSGDRADVDVSQESSEVSKNDDSQSDVKTSIETTEEVQTDTDSCSVDVVESTTSEISEATESTAPSEVKDAEAQDSSVDDVALEATRQECSVQLTDILKDPQVGESDAAPSDSENPLRPGMSTIRNVKPRRSLRPDLSYPLLSCRSQSAKSPSRAKISADQAGPSNRDVSGHYRSLCSDSPPTSTSGTSSTSELKRANLMRRNNDDAPAREKKQKIEGGEIKIKTITGEKTLVSHVAIQPFVKRTYCNIL